MQREQLVDQKITRLIFEKPDAVANILKKRGYSLPSKVTLQSINEAVFNALYIEQNKELADDLDNLSQGDGYSNFIFLAITAAISIASIISSSKAAKKARELQMKIALASLSQEKMLRELEIRTNAETARTEILINSLQKYQSDLQAQSTQRIKDVWIYMGMLGVSISIIYATAVLVKNS